MLAQMPTMQLPHYFVMKALADFARASPRKFIPHLKLAMTKVLPLLSLVKQDNMKWAFAAKVALHIFKPIHTTHFFVIMLCVHLLCGVLAYMCFFMPGLCVFVCQGCVFSVCECVIVH